MIAIIRKLRLSNVTLYWIPGHLTSFGKSLAKYMGMKEAIRHDERYAPAEEYTDLVYPYLPPKILSRFNNKY